MKNCDWTLENSDGVKMWVHDFESRILPPCVSCSSFDRFEETEYAELADQLNEIADKLHEIAPTVTAETVINALKSHGFEVVEMKRD